MTLDLGLLRVFLPLFPQRECYQVYPILITTVYKRWELRGGRDYLLLLFADQRTKRRYIWAWWQGRQSPKVLSFEVSAVTAWIFCCLSWAWYASRGKKLPDLSPEDRQVCTHPHMLLYICQPLVRHALNLKSYITSWDRKQVHVHVDEIDVFCL